MARRPGPIASKEQRKPYGELVDIVSERTGYHRDAVNTVVKEFHRAICDAIDDGALIINLRPYYKIEVMYRPERMNGCHPITGERNLIPEMNYLRLTPLMHYNRAVGYDNKYMRTRKEEVERNLAKREEKRLAKLASLREKNGVDD